MTAKRCVVGVPFLYSEKNKKRCKSMSKKRTDVPENKRTQNRTQKLSYEEIKELMGIYRPTYKRSRGGALKSK
ncbi:hypothetical protein [Bacillus pumilus]|uniref:hypothetical protein n=1 Tax=Bacillus pumilus TaxID=1408 RepID=UPI002281533C|nr:hypothetical protein [Bacillus pumilus]MCY7572857.1 hypothetical protein [Bacillus pumilus]MCY7578249.1 hypothetical protein [Bacillus pumilus]MEC3761270.1 hypothetical protein [Bacillus pumilus]